jgi:hypothetical protein
VVTDAGISFERANAEGCHAIDERAIGCDERTDPRAEHGMIPFQHAQVLAVLPTAIGFLSCRDERLRDHGIAL